MSFFQGLKKILRYSFCGPLTEEELDEAEKRWPGARQRHAAVIRRLKAERCAVIPPMEPASVSDPVVMGRSLAFNPTHPTAKQILKDRHSQQTR